MLVDYSDSEEEDRESETSAATRHLVRTETSDAFKEQFTNFTSPSSTSAIKGTKSGSRSDSDPASCKALTKRKRSSSPPQTLSAKLPPLPSSFQSLYATNVRTSTNDDPCLHGGRKRQVTHVAGHWPSHVYLEWWPPKEQLELLEDLVEQVRLKLTSQHSSTTSVSQLQGFCRSELGAQLPLHVSLSAPLTLSTTNKQDFEDSLVDRLVHSQVSRVIVQPTRLALVSNFDHTRSFLILRLSRPENDGLNVLLKLANDCAGQFGLPTLYESGSGKAWFPTLGDGEPGSGGRSSAFHISIAWTLDEGNVWLKQDLEEIALPDHLKSHEIMFETVKVKIGNVVRDVALKQ